MGASVAIENYTGHELTWKRGGEATFKEKGHEFETLDPRANNIGLANVIATDPNDPDYDPSRLHLIGKPLSADPSYVLEPSSTKEGSPFSNASNTVPGLNSILAIPHDKFGQNPLINKAPILQLTIPPFIPIGYYGLIGKSIRNTYEQPKVNNSTVGKP
ncbi:MAG: hypothetical protein EBS92_00965 [Proteobacteria bacterium]|nr:hypothetical protein [Pseudomonadota bacterium]